MGLLTHLTSKQWNTYHVPDAMLDTEVHKGKQADTQPCPVQILCVCVSRENTRTRKIILYFHLQLFFSLKGREEAYITIKQNKQMQDQGKFTLWQKIKFKEEEYRYYLVTEVGAQIWFCAYRQVKGSINSKWFALLMKRKHQGFSGEISYSLYFDLKDISLFVNCPYAILLASRRSLEDF